MTSLLRLPAEGQRPALFMQTQWSGPAAHSALSLRLTNGSRMWQAQANADRIAELSSHTSLQRQDYFQKLAAAFDDRGVLDFVYEVQSDEDDPGQYKTLTIKYRTGDGVKVVLIKLDLKPIEAQSSGEVLALLQDLLVTSLMSLDSTEAGTEKIVAERRRIEQQAAQMELRVAEIPTEMDDSLAESKAMLVGTLNKVKQDIRRVKQRLGNSNGEAAAGRK